MMYQNQQSAKDRLETEIDYSVNVHAELAVRYLSDRLEIIEQSLRNIEKQTTVTDCPGIKPESDKTNS